MARMLAEPLNYTVHWDLDNTDLELLTKLKDVGQCVHSPLLALPNGTCVTLEIYPNGSKDDDIGHWSIRLDPSKMINSSAFTFECLKLDMFLILSIPSLDICVTNRFGAVERRKGDERALYWGNFMKKPEASTFSSVKLTVRLMIFDIVESNPFPTMITDSSLTSIGAEPGADDGFKSWMQQFGFRAECAPLLIENGFDSMDAVKMLTDDLLKEIGVTKMGHRMVLLKAVAKPNAPKVGTAGGESGSLFY